MIIKVKFQEQSKLLKTGFDSSLKIVQQAVENYYEGSYEITPSVNDQLLKTAAKTMKNDLQINGIPYYEVTNLSGGKTVTIA